MNLQTELENSPNTTSSESEVVALIKKLERHMAFLEKKLDILVAASSQKPFQKSFKEKRFSKPFRSGGKFRHRGQGEGGNRSSGGYSHPRQRRENGNRSSDRDERSNDRSFDRGDSFRRGSFERSDGGRGPGFSRKKKRPFRHKKSRY